jgi:hypothetical protein
MLTHIIDSANCHVMVSPAKYDQLSGFWHI